MGAPFISRQDLTDILGRDVTNDAGALIAVDAACMTVRTLTEQDLDQTIGEVATLDGTGTDCLLLPELPVTQAGTVTINGGTITNYVLADNGRLIRKSDGGTTGQDCWGWGWGGWVGWGPPFYPSSPSWGRYDWEPGIVWPLGRQNIQVTYDHGYGTADMPSDLRRVALSMAMRFLVQGVAIQEQIGDVNIRYAGPAGDPTPGELRIMRKYRPTR